MEERDAIHLTFEDEMREGPHWYDMVVCWSGVDCVVKQSINGTGGGNGNSSGDGNGSGIGIAQSSAGNECNSVAVYSSIRIWYAIQDIAKEDSTSSSGDQMNTMEQGCILQQHFGNSTYCLTGNYSNDIKRDTTRCCFIIFRNALSFSKPAARMDGKNVALKASSKAERIQQQMRQQIDDAKIPTRTTRPIIDRLIDKADHFF